ncbi:hypothetical protein [Anthocerotibacter panamensis]|uniref:hypothetical protein n=1 Tax=Anthocerotibacter panamensis TaxID=2857077 RepID=UPI001C40209C|nr:hypothetical protein [Anthocerotibacter panamensis]
MDCPVCRAVYRPHGEGFTCRRCGADLAALIQVHDRALWHYRQALNLLDQERYSAAQTANAQALALHQRSADFHDLAGRLAALTEDWPQAVASWRRALLLDPQHPRAARCLEALQEALQD